MQLRHKLVDWQEGCIYSREIIEKQQVMLLNLSSKFFSSILIYRTVLYQIVMQFQIRVLGETDVMTYRAAEDVNEMEYTNGWCASDHEKIVKID